MAERDVQGVAFCKGPCAEPTLHRVIRPVVRGRVFLKCAICGTTHNIPKPEPVKAT